MKTKCLFILLSLSTFGWKGLFSQIEYTKSNKGLDSCIARSCCIKTYDFIFIKGKLDPVASKPALDSLFSLLKQHPSETVYIVNYDYEKKLETQDVSSREKRSQEIILYVLKHSAFKNIKQGDHAPRAIYGSEVESQMGTDSYIAPPKRDDRGWVQICFWN